MQRCNAGVSPRHLLSALSPGGPQIGARPASPGSYGGYARPSEPRVAAAVAWPAVGGVAAAAPAWAGEDEVDAVANWLKRLDPDRTKTAEELDVLLRDYNKLFLR